MQPEEIDFDYEERPEGAIWCDRCQGLGMAECYCGGDQCYCENNGEMDCPQCGGEGFYVPTAKQLAFEADMRRVLGDALASVDERPQGQDPEGLEAKPASAVPNEDSADAQPSASPTHGTSKSRAEQRVGGE